MTVNSWHPIAGVMLASLALVACTPTVPDSGPNSGPNSGPESGAAARSAAGVGFQDYNSYIRGPAGAPAAPLAAAGGFDPAAAAAAIDRADGVGAPLPAVIGADLAAVDSTNRPRGGAPAGIREESGEMVHNNTGISDEQDFAAVASRETIESDRERIERNRSEYVVVQPTDLPQRPGETGPNIVEYALGSTHAPGVQLHKRSTIGKRDPATACAQFTSPDIAQSEFLAAGGPERDRKGVDPDGDGFACAWDPRPFRTALQ